MGDPCSPAGCPPNAPPTRSRGQPRCQAFPCFWSQTLESGWEGRSAESLRRQGWGAEGGLSEIPKCGLPGGLCWEKHRAPRPSAGNELGVLGALFPCLPTAEKEARSDQLEVLGAWVQGMGRRRAGWAPPTLSRWLPSEGPVGLGHECAPGCLHWTATTRAFVALQLA